jgi:hypothetical protein
MDILELFNNWSSAGRGLALLPVRGLDLACSFEIEGVHFASASEIGGLDILLQEVDDRFFVPIQTVSDDFYLSEMTGDTLRRFCSTTTGISNEALLVSTLAVLAVDTDWQAFSTQTHAEDVALLETLSARAFRSLDFVRFLFCQLNLPDTLPGIPGCWDTPSGFLGAAVLGPVGSGRLLGGRKTGSAMVEGLGLELNASQILAIGTDESSTVIRSLDCGGEIGSAARRGMRMLSRAMHSNSDTLKFIAAMSLFEYLATGAQFSHFDKVRSRIQSHVARSRAEYLDLGKRFKELISKEDGGRKVGYRHRIVHEGAFLEEILPAVDARKALFGELDRYAGIVIGDMCRSASFSWDQLESWRKARQEELGVA